MSDRLTAPITFGGYLTPSADGIHVLGATFDRDTDWNSDAWAAVRENDHLRNLECVAQRLPRLAAALGDVTGGWTRLRTTTPDRAPVVGPVPNGEAFASAFSALHHGGATGDLGRDLNHPGLFVLSGLGSRGFLTAPLAGEILASQMLGLPLPVPAGVPPLLQPGRFLIRNIKKGRA
jgi:tRNA 5-methylaminomethyl-2-thiouridine biosynthesis bifunctional protein